MIKSFNKFGVMIDCSRNAVMTVDALKRFITVISRMGYNQVHLYMEDTYEVDSRMFGYLRGRYSKEELKELDDFAYNLGVELVPNIQTLAHMNAFLRWRGDILDAGDIMLAGDERVYDLINRMFSSLRESFRTEKIHIGMDEAHLLGRGNYYDKNGPKDKTEILLSHLNRVCEIAKQYNFEPMMWSDMFYRIANGGEYYAANSKFDPSIKEKMPEGLKLVYWDYYTTDKKVFKGMIKGHRQLCDDVIFAGGAWRWSSVAPNNYFAIRTTKLAVKACMDGGIKDMFMTMWGDAGGECSSFSVLPTLCYASCIAQGITKMSDIKAKFYEWVGVRYDDFMLLDAPNRIEPVDIVINPAKYFFYADCFMSVVQNNEKAEYSKTYLATARKLKYAAKRAGEYAYIFETLSKLCEVLSIKQDICTRTREAYKNSDMAALDQIIADYKKMIKRTEEFHKAFQTQWFTDNKPHGFDVQDARIGGVIQRMKSCMARLIDFKDGKIFSIPELEEKNEPFMRGLGQFNNYNQNITTNVTHW